MKISATLGLLSIMALCGCGGQGSEPPKPGVLLDTALLKRLVGHWNDTTSDGTSVFHERWQMVDHERMDGIGFVLSDRDTVSLEHLRIHLTDSGTWYLAQVPTQNDGGTVPFRLVHGTDSLVFTNPEHDFPQRITYVPVGKDGWQVTVAGLILGEQQQELFQLRPLWETAPAVAP